MSEKVCIRCHQPFMSTADAGRTYGFARPHEGEVGPIINGNSLICYHCVWREIDLVQMYGYSEVLQLSGKVGCSELGMHCRIAERTGLYARLHPDEPNYAFVLTDDGRWTQGSFCHFGDGRFSLS